MAQSILDHTPFPLAHCNRATRYVYVNKSYAALIGRPPDDIVGQRVIDVIGADAFETIRPHIEAVLGGERVEFETEIKLAHLEPRQYQVILVPEWDELSQVVGYIVSIFDVTERKRAIEEKMRLERLVAQLSMPLASARIGIWDWNMRTGSVSCTPELEAIFGLEATGLRSYADLRDLVHPDDIHDVIARREEAMKAHKTFQLENRIIRPDGQVRWVMAVGGAVYDKVTGEPVRVMGSCVDITDMKANEAQAELQLSIATEETEEGKVVMSIRDRGPGMSPDKLKRIFEPFFTTKAGGLGLGLSICRNIVTLHHGQLSLRNASEGGIVATVSLPKSGARLAMVS